MPTVLITGANRGIGWELATQYAADDWQVLACSRGESEQLAELCASQGHVSQHRVELTDHAGIDALAQELESIPIDVLLLSAGTMGNVDFAARGLEVGGFDEADYADWELQFRVNTIGAMKMAQAFVTHVERSKQRKIVALSSMVASMGINTAGGLYAYRAGKAALNAVMRSMSVDLAPRGIIALPMHPGWASTDMGGPQAPLSAEASASGVRKVIAGLGPTDAGRFLCYDGSEMPW